MLSMVIQVSHTCRPKIIGDSFVFDDKCDPLESLLVTTCGVVGFIP
jgi:hypothetical protein